MKCLPKDAWFNLTLQHWVPVRVTLHLFNFITEYMHSDVGRACAACLQNGSGGAGIVFCVFFVSLGSFPDCAASDRQSVLKRVNWIVCQASGHLASVWWVPHDTFLLCLTRPVKKYYVVLDHDHSSWMLSVKYLAHTVDCSKKHPRKPIVKLLKVLSLKACFCSSA